MVLRLHTTTSSSADASCCRIDCSASTCEPIAISRIRAAAVARPCARASIGWSTSAASSRGTRPVGSGSQSALPRQRWSGESFSSPREGPQVHRTDVARLRAMSGAVLLTYACRSFLRGWCERCSPPGREERCDCSGGGSGTTPLLLRRA